MHIVFVGAHADDAEIWAGGTLLEHQHKGARATVLLRSPKEVVRKVEQEKAAALSGLAVEMFHSAADLTQRVSALRPDVLITHWTEDSHPDHRSVAALALRAARALKVKTGLPTRLFACDTYNKLGLHGEFAPTLYVNVSAFVEAKRRLIRCFESQDPEFWIRQVELITALYGSRCGCAHAEGFLEYSFLGCRAASVGFAS